MAKDYSDFGIEIPFGRKSGHIKTFCPKCRDSRSNKRDRSLSVDLDNGLWKCHYCQWSGGLPKDRGYESSLKYQRKEYVKPALKGSALLSEKALRWFAERGISMQTLTKMKITESKEWMPQKGKEVNTIQFNYYKDGELINTKFRTGDKCFKLVSNAELIPYNLDAIKGSMSCVITEGEMDTLSFVECGREDVISVPNGANANLSYLDDYLEEYFDDKEIIYIASDSDTKGVMLREELLRRFGPERCKVVEYGEGCKDANEHLMMYGKDSLLQCLNNAIEPKIEGVFHIEDVEKPLDLLYRKGLQRGYTIGFENFDELCSFETKRLCILTGIPSSGKSAFLNFIAVRMNILYDWKFAFFSPESMPIDYHVSTLIEIITGKKFSESTLPYMEYEAAKQYANDNFFFIYPESYTMGNILDKARSLVRKKGIKALVIDPYNRVESEQDYRQSETQHISKVLDQLTNFAQQNDVLIFLMAHPTKMPKTPDGKHQVPTLYDISGSANFYNKADFGITVHRDRENGWTEVHIQKVKYRHLGQNGTVRFKFNLFNSRYVPLEDGLDPQWDTSNYLANKANSVKTESMFEPNTDFDNDLPF
jgi:twinkle protein